MTHAATRTEVEKVTGEIIVGCGMYANPLYAKNLVERINKLVEALEDIAEERYPQDGPITTHSAHQWMIAVADNALADYRGTKE